ncbi:MAG: cytochrome b562 [Verrucomicrobiota bacterium]
MKIRLSLLALACAFTVTVVPVQVQAADEPETELGGKMEKMSSAFRALRRQIKDSSKNADSLAKLATIKENAIASTKYEPARKAEVPAAEQAKFVAAYQAKMKEFIALVDKVEAALKANNNEEADKLLGAMADAQKKGHTDFKKNSKKS